MEDSKSDLKDLIAAGFPEDFVKKYYKAMTAWALQHGNVNFPILTTPIVNNKGETIRIEYRWVNRKARRGR